MGPGRPCAPILRSDVDADVRTTKPVVTPVSGVLSILPDAAVEACGVRANNELEI